VLSEKQINAIKIIYDRLKNQDIIWAFTGTTNFALQGMDISPNDIDIQTDASGAYKIEELLSEFLTKKVQFSSTQTIRSHFGKLNIIGVKVEIIGDIQKNVNGKWEETINLCDYISSVDLRAMKLPVISLEYEAEAYEKLQRFGRAKELREFLKMTESNKSEM